MAGAVALLAPTLYIEPFGGVAVEAMLSGTPAITSDFGAFTETVETGRTGFRFRTLAEGAQAVGAATTIDPLGARERAVERFAMENVAPAYLRVLERLEGLYGAGFNA
jgi:glycosyltransferase involved in cell wall biosynthesis